MLNYNTSDLNSLHLETKHLLQIISAHEHVYTPPHIVHIARLANLIQRKQSTSATHSLPVTSDRPPPPSRPLVRRPSTDFRLTALADSRHFHRHHHCCHSWRDVCWCVTTSAADRVDAAAFVCRNSCLSSLRHCPSQPSPELRPTSRIGTDCRRPH